MWKARSLSQVQADVLRQRKRLMTSSGARPHRSNNQFNRGSQARQPIHLKPCHTHRSQSNTGYALDRATARNGTTLLVGKALGSGVGAIGRPKAAARGAVTRSAASRAGS